MDNVEKLNILVVHNYYQQSGGEDLVFENELELLKKHGNNVITYTRNNNEISNSLLRKILFPLIVIFNFKTYFDIKKIIIKYNIDIIHVHNTMFFVSQSIYYAAKLLKIPIVQSIHNFRFVCPNALLYRNKTVCEQCISNGVFQSVRNKCYKNSFLITLIMALNIKIHKITRIHNYVNFICNTNFTSSKILSDKTILKNKVYIKNNFTITDYSVNVLNERENSFVFAARLDENKGIDFLLKSWKVFNNLHYKLYICGAGNLQSWCENFIIDNNITNVEMLGYINHEDMLKLFSKCLALIYPSKWYEVMPIGIIDAFSVGTPVIGPDFGNMEEMIKSNFNGFKYNYEDTNSFINALNNIINFDFEYNNIRQYYLDNYSDNNNYNNLIKIYRSIINS